MYATNMKNISRRAETIFNEDSLPSLIAYTVSGIFAFLSTLMIIGGDFIFAIVLFVMAGYIFDLGREAGEKQKLEEKRRMDEEVFWG